MKQLFLFLTLFSVVVLAQTETQDSKMTNKLKLWPDAVPGSKSPKTEHVFKEKQEGQVAMIERVTDPDLHVYVPENPNALRAAIAIFPGGGYGILAHEHEGSAVAKWLNSLGYHAFVVHYRVPRQKEGALQDAQRAMRLIKANAAKYAINPNKVGVLGFSAGGDLAARASTRFAEETYKSIDAADALSSKPAFSVLIYPAYLDSGENKSISPELKITEHTPTTFIFTAFDDFDYVNGSLVYASELQKAKVPYSLRIFPNGKHGFGLSDRNEAAKQWPKDLAIWLSEVVK
jgi:acetyl esterase/lipase